MVSKIFLDVDGCTLLLLMNKVGNGAMAVLGHLFYDAVALRVNSGVIEWVLGIGDAKESCTLLIGCWSEARNLLQLGT